MNSCELWKTTKIIFIQNYEFLTFYIQSNLRPDLILFGINL